MEEARFPRKYGAVWTASEQTPSYDVDWDGLSPDCHAEIRFDERPQQGVNKNHTYDVDRGKFDLLLLQHAQQAGAAVYEGVKVSGVDFAPALPEVRFKMGRREMGVNVRMVVDASGRQTLLGNQPRIKVKDPVFDQYAIHTWFGDFDRSAVAKSDAQCDYIYIHFLPVSNTWMWQIPITDDITSIGIVTQKKNFAGSRQDREQFFWNAVSSRPKLYDALRAATQLRTFREEGDYSYAMKQILNSSRFAQQDILLALERNDFSRESFHTFETMIGRGTKNWYDFINVYYRLNVLFTYFISDRRYRLDVLKLLQGDVYDEEQPPVLAKMRKMAADVEETPGHICRDLLGSLTANAFLPA